MDTFEFHAMMYNSVGDSAALLRMIRRLEEYMSSPGWGHKTQWVCRHLELLQAAYRDRQAVEHGVG